MTHAIHRTNILTVFMWFFKMFTSRLGVTTQSPHLPSSFQNRAGRELRGGLACGPTAPCGLVRNHRAGSSHHRSRFLCSFQQPCLRLALREGVVVQHSFLLLRQHDSFCGSTPRASLPLIVSLLHIVRQTTVPRVAGNKTGKCGSFLTWCLLVCYLSNSAVEVASTA